MRLEPPGERPADAPDALEPRDGPEGSVLDAIGDDPARQRRSDHGNGGDFIQRSGVEVHGRPGRRSGGTADCGRWCAGGLEALARGARICRRVAIVERRTSRARSWRGGSRASGGSRVRPLPGKARARRILGRHRGALRRFDGSPRRRRAGRGASLRSHGAHAAPSGVRGDRRIHGLDLPREGVRIARDRRDVRTAHLLPAAQGNAQRRDRGDEDQGAALSGGRHAHTIHAPPPRSVTVRLRRSAIQRAPISSPPATAAAPPPRRRRS